MLKELGKLVPLFESVGATWDRDTFEHLQDKFKETLPYLDEGIYNIFQFSDVIRFFMYTKFMNRTPSLQALALGSATINNIKMNSLPQPFADLEVIDLEALKKS